MAWPATFKPQAGGCRVAFEEEQNRPLFVALFRHIQARARPRAPRRLLDASLQAGSVRGAPAGWTQRPKCGPAGCSLPRPCSAVHGCAPRGASCCRTLTLPHAARRA